MGNGGIFFSIQAVRWGFWCIIIYKCFLFSIIHLNFSYWRDQYTTVKSKIGSVYAEIIINMNTFMERKDNVDINSLSPELNPICHLLALLVHHFLHVSRIGVKSLTLRLLMSYIYIYDISSLRVKTWISNAVYRTETANVGPTLSTGNLTAEIWNNEIKHPTIGKFETKIQPKLK
jgi:hypothetical protein